MNINVNKILILIRYEKQIGTVQGMTSSKRYNEMALLFSMKLLIQTLKNIEVNELRNIITHHFYHHRAMWKNLCDHCWKLLYKKRILQLEEPLSPHPQTIFSAAYSTSGSEDSQDNNALRKYYRENILKNKGNLELSYEEEVDGKYTRIRDVDTKEKRQSPVEREIPSTTPHSNLLLNPISLKTFKYIPIFIHSSSPDNNDGPSPPSRYNPIPLSSEQLDEFSMDVNRSGMNDGNDTINDDTFNLSRGDDDFSRADTNQPFIPPLTLSLALTNFEVEASMETETGHGDVSRGEFDMSRGDLDQRSNNNNNDNSNNNNLTTTKNNNNNNNNNTENEVHNLSLATNSPRNKDLTRNKDLKSNSPNSANSANRPDSPRSSSRALLTKKETIVRKRDLPTPTFQQQTIHHALQSSALVIPIQASNMVGVISPERLKAVTEKPKKTKITKNNFISNWIHAAGSSSSSTASIKRFKKKYKGIVEKY
jgi:hypothetical protein